MDKINQDQAKLDEIRRQAALNKTPQTPPRKRSIKAPVKEPLISKILYVLAIASMIVGLALFGRDWGSRVISIAFLISGFVQGVFFISMGLALTYLKGIYENTRGE